MTSLGVGDRNVSGPLGAADRDSQAGGLAATSGPGGVVPSVLFSRHVSSSLLDTT
eukprot:CAMPEP_0202884118 /NCGR_PEP_ID=MMETSP1391-20130828/40446_1 /ASSEMBLY_ACC=CAM_ASM_000867 /TAXON_ID=1034604 /ORGANISM="Chlamydomonas leiostraca, Strain SAG 11-49" /LENGTH=54 /DNA_ID=CAMNT_0049567249 /DNA_START=30 /DNA_END=191 /DNA_ORIENTATION=-